MPTVQTETRRARMTPERLATNAALLESTRPAEPDELPPGHVRAKVMKRGHNRISTGATCPLETVKFPNYYQGDVITLPRDTATKYEDDGMVEILP